MHPYITCARAAQACGARLPAPDQVRLGRAGGLNNITKLDMRTLHILSRTLRVTLAHKGGKCPFIGSLERRTRSLEAQVFSPRRLATG